MKLGDIVQVIGKLDNRIRDNVKDEIVKGTLYCWVRTETAEVCVILENMDLYLGMKSDIVVINDEKV